MKNSPCQAVKMKLHSRIETYSHIFPLSEAKTLQAPTISPFSPSRDYQSSSPKSRCIISYKPSSHLYQKLNVKITLHKLELFRSHLNSPGTRSTYRQQTFKKIIGPQVLLSKNFQTVGHGQVLNLSTRAS